MGLHGHLFPKKKWEELKKNGADVGNREEEVSGRRRKEKKNGGRRGAAQEKYLGI
jgi:hypothetical protein